MGNCPSGFQLSPSGNWTCVHECPRQQGFDLLKLNGTTSCVYRDRPEVSFPLQEVPSINTQGQIITVDQITNPGLKAPFQTAIEDYNKNSAIALGKIAKDVQIADAFRELQIAENVRDKSPQAYQDARIRYYTLVNGESWVNEERERIAKAEVTPKLQEFVSVYDDLNQRSQQQQKTMEVANGVKDKLLSMKDDFELTTGAFAKQLNALKSQIQIEKKASAFQTAEVLSWVGTLLNVLLVLVLIVAIVVIVRRLRTPASTDKTFVVRPRSFT